MLFADEARGKLSVRTREIQIRLAAIAELNWQLVEFVGELMRRNNRGSNSATLPSAILATARGAVHFGCRCRNDSRSSQTARPSVPAPRAE